MQITDESTDALSLRAEDSKPVVAAEGLNVDEVVGGDVTILADVGDNGLEILFLVRIKCCVGEEVCIALGGLLPVDSDDGTDECGHYVATEHLAATDVGLVFFLGAEVTPADGLQLDDVGVGELFQGEEFLQDRKVTVGFEPIHHALAVGDGELRANGRSVIFYNVGDVEGKLFALLGEDELHQVAHFVTDKLQAVQGDVLHVGRICHFIDEGQLGGHLRNGGFLLQGLCNLADLVLGLGAFDLFIDQRELDVEDQDVEAQRCVVGQMAYQNGCHFLFEVDGVNAGDVGPVFLLLELVHDFTGLADGDAFEVEFLYLTPEDVFQLVVEALGELICLVRGVLQDSSEIHAEVKEAFRQGLGRNRVAAIRCLAEILDIAAPVEDEEELLIDALTEDVIAFAGATADHLPEFNLGLHLLKEDQVEDFRHIDSGVQHIHGNGNLRHFGRDAEVVDEVLGASMRWTGMPVGFDSGEGVAFHTHLQSLVQPEGVDMGFCCI